MARSTQAILAAQLAGKVPRVKTCTISFPTIPENWNSGRSSLRWIRICNRLAPHGDSHMLNHRMTRPPYPKTGYGRLDAFGPNPGEQRHGVGNRMGCGLGPLPFVPSPSHWCAVSKASPVKRSPGQKARRLKEPIPLKRFAHTGKTPHRVSLPWGTAVFYFPDNRFNAGSTACAKAARRGRRTRKSRRRPAPRRQRRTARRTDARRHCR